MKKKLLPVLAAVALLAACGEETRNGQLTLAGAQPLTIVDQGGAKVDFAAGPLKVVFSADSGRKFTVSLEQGNSKAKFSGRVPDSGDWNFKVRGGDIGQAVDIASARSVELYGPIWTQMGTGGFCGFNGTWMTEEDWRKGNESWSVDFTDAKTGGAVGAFKSSLQGQNYLIGTRNVWCRERPEPHEPHIPFPRGPRNMSDTLSQLQDKGVKFD